jgi:hypothetical protein
MDGDALASAGWGTDEDYGWWWLLVSVPSGRPRSSDNDPIKSIKKIVPNSPEDQAQCQWVVLVWNL